MNDLRPSSIYKWGAPTPGLATAWEPSLLQV